ncbi:hypothetical protein C0J52_19133 [Blattella germanica]|nr:hypothetical protein C0J52_19133 [Blattella germanica]
MRMFNCSNLEEVFLILSTKQENSQLDVIQGNGKANPRRHKKRQNQKHRNKETNKPTRRHQHSRKTEMDVGRTRRENGRLQMGVQGNNMGPKEREASGGVTKNKVGRLARK